MMRTKLQTGTQSRVAQRRILTAILLAALLLVSQFSYLASPTYAAPQAKSTNIFKRFIDKFFPRTISPIPMPKRTVLGEENTVTTPQANPLALEDLELRIASLENQFAFGTPTTLSSPFSTGSNLIRNSSYESADGKKPRQWTYIYDSTTSNSMQTEEGIRSGNYGLKFSGATSSGRGLDLGISQPESETAPQRTYTLSVYVKHTNVTDDAFIRLGFWNKYNNEFGSMKTVPINGTKDWYRISTTVETTGVITDYANWYPILEVRGLKDGAAVYIDDVQLEEGSVLTVYNSASASGGTFGSAFGDGSILATSTSTLYPAEDGIGALGTSSNRWNALYLSKATIDDGGNLSLDGSATVGSLTVNGNSTLKGDITFGDSSDDTIRFTGTPTFSSTSSFTGGISVGANGEFSINSSGDITKIKGVAYAFPSSQGAASSVLMNDGTGALSWGTFGAASVTADSLDFAQFVDAMTVDADTSINLYNSGATDLRFYNSNSGSEMLFLDGSTGRVGIGNTAPGSLLELGYNAGIVNDQAGGLQVNYGSDMGTTTFGFTDYNLDRPILTLRTPNGLLGTNAGVQTALMIDAQSWDFSQNTGVAIEMGRSGYSSRIVNYGNNVSSNGTRLQLQTHKAVAGSWNVGIFLNEHGNVGIGTTNPGAKLQIADGDILISHTQNLSSLNSVGTTIPLLTLGIGNVVAGNNTIIIAKGANGFELGTSGGAAIVGKQAGINTLHFITGASEKATILANGNVGIGTTAPGYKLDVSGNLNLSTASTFKINGTDVLSATTLGSGVITSSLTTVGALNAGSIASGFGSIDVGTDTITTSGAISGGTLTDGTITFADTAWTSTGAIAWDLANAQARAFNVENGLLTLDTQNSRVGIGTTSPSGVLDVITPTYGSIYLGGLPPGGGAGNVVQLTHGSFDSSSAAFQIRGVGRDGNNRDIAFGAGTGNYSGKPTQLLLSTDGNVSTSGRFVVSGTGNTTIAGNVGIGTTAPGSPLEVYTNTSGRALRISRNSTPLSSYWDIGAVYDFANPNLIFSSNGTERLRFDANGNVGIGYTSQSLAGGKLLVNGNVGIGTTNPGAFALNVNGTVRTGALTVNAGDIAMTSGNGISWPSWLAYQSGSSFFVRDTVNAVQTLQLTGGTGVNGTLALNGDIRINGTGTNYILGNVGIGNTNPQYKFDVAGDINTTGDIRKNGTAYTNPDYVFEPDYELMSLESLKGYVADNKHLPNVPSSEDVRQNGVKLFEQTRLNLEKTEEAYLYLFDLDSRVNALSLPQDPPETTTLASVSSTDLDTAALHEELAAVKDQMLTLEERLALGEEEKMASVSATLASLKTDVELLKTTQTVASVSATLAGSDLPITDGDETVLSDLVVSGKANIFDLAVLNRISAGLLAIDGLSCTDGTDCVAAIGTLNGTLALQPTASGPLEIMAGKITIDTNGDMKIDGKLTVNEVEAEKIKTKSVETERVVLGEDAVFTSGNTLPSGTCQTGAVYVYNDKRNKQAHMYLCSEESWQEVITKTSVSSETATPSATPTPTTVSPTTPVTPTPSSIPVSSSPEPSPQSGTVQSPTGANE